MRSIALRDVTGESSYGGKAVQLGEALRAGLPVPAGAACSVATMDALLGGAPFPEDEAASLFATFGPSLAVRSSVVGEDGAHASFAGLHATVLNVTSAVELEAALREVGASATNEAALAYRRRCNIEGAPRVAAVVQAMVHADRAGVMFTRDPISRRHERVIEASWGLGEAVVAGLVTPDFFRLDCGGTVLEHRLGNKDREVAYRPSGGTHEIPVAPARQYVLCLGTSCLAQLHELATACEQAWPDRGAHDVEWAFEGATLYLLQRRAMTTR